MIKHRKTHSPSITWGKIARPEKVEALLNQAKLVNPPTPISAGAIEARNNLEKLKGEAMPDLNTALRTALEHGKRAALSQTLNEWEKDEKETQMEKPVTDGRTNLHAITTNVTRATFDFVKNHPNCTRDDIKKGMGQYNLISVFSLIAQFIVQQQIVCDAQGRHKTIVPEYRPLTSRKKWDKDHGVVRVVKRRGKNKEKAKASVKASPASPSGIAALPQPVEEKKPEVTSILISRNWTAQGVVDKLTVMQARQLYDLLKSIFGG